VRVERNVNSEYRKKLIVEERKTTYEKVYKQKNIKNTGKKNYFVFFGFFFSEANY
jgi:hypothetical protein